MSLKKCSEIFYRLNLIKKYGEKWQYAMSKNESEILRELTNRTDKIFKSLILKQSK